MPGLIPQSFIDDLISRADIVDVVGDRVQLKKTGKNYSGLCPFHQEKTPSFTVEPDKQFYYCFGCGAGGNSLGFIMNYENLDYPQAIENLATSMGMEVPREESTQERAQRDRHQALFDVLDQACRYYQSQLRQHPQRSKAVDYLKNRGVSGEIARDYALGYAPPGWQNLIEATSDLKENTRLLMEAGLVIESSSNQRNPYYDRFRDRIIYPIRDRRGRVIGFGGRVLGDDKPKYLNSPETPVFHKGEELYGLYELRQKVRQPDKILIVEGYMDVIALSQHGIPYCVATLGTATSVRHIEILFRQVPEIIFCFDGDNAGRQAAWRALLNTLPHMQDGKSARFLFLPEGEDPDTQIRKIGRQSFESRIREATQLTEFFFDELCSQVDMHSLEGRAKLGNIALPHLQKLPDGFFRQLMQDKLASITGVNPATLNRNQVEQSVPEYRPSPPDQAPETAGIAFRKPKVSEYSPCMKAINLLLLSPKIVKKIADQKELIDKFEAPDSELLKKVVSLALNNPESTTPELLGRIYASPEGGKLLNLLDREQITPEEGAEREFMDIISHLIKQQERKISQQALKQKARDKLQQKRQNPVSMPETGSQSSD